MSESVGIVVDVRDSLQQRIAFAEVEDNPYAWVRVWRGGQAISFTAADLARGTLSKRFQPGYIVQLPPDVVATFDRAENERSCPEIGRKDDDGKAPWHLLPFWALDRVVHVLAYGAKRYGAENWRKVEPGRGRYFAACMRHLAAWWQGERNDPESGLPHLAHAAACVLFLIEIEESH